MSINDALIAVNPLEILRLVGTFQEFDKEHPNKSQSGGSSAGGCPFSAHAKEMAKNEDIDTFSRY